MKTAEYVCLKCGRNFDLYGEYLELVDSRGRTIGVGCALCGGRAEKATGEIEIGETEKGDN